MAMRSKVVATVVVAAIIVVVVVCGPVATVYVLG